jgi:hypothetical protein
LILFGRFSKVFISWIKFFFIEFLFKLWNII